MKARSWIGQSRLSALKQGVLIYTLDVLPIFSRGKVTACPYRRLGRASLKLATALTLAFIFIFPSQMSAASVSDLTDVFILSQETLTAVVALLIGIAVVIFLFGVVKYIIGGDNAEKRKEGSMFMLYAIIAIFVMISVWGLVEVIRNSVNLNFTDPVVPQY